VVDIAKEAVFVAVVLVAMVMVDIEDEIDDEVVDFMDIDAPVSDKAPVVIIISSVDFTAVEPFFDDSTAFVVEVISDIESEVISDEASV